MCCCNQEASDNSQLGSVKVRRSSLKWKNKAPMSARPRKNKRVRFAPKEQVAFRHVTQQELKATWYQQDEFEDFKQECRKTARVYSKVQGDITQINPDKVCLRGLEQHLSRDLIASRKMTIINSIRMVLNEQKCQRSKGAANPFKLEEVSSTWSQYARTRAMTMADFDAKLCKLF
jgi:hypothetical protein